MRSLALILTSGLISVSLVGCGGGESNTAAPAVTFGDPPEVTVGERLFLETRFAQFYAKNFSGNVNQPLAFGDPAVATLPGIFGNMPGPFAGQTMNCRQCHLVDEQFGAPGGGNRTYSDFARRSAITDRGDGPAQTVRNSPALVNSTTPRAVDFILHADGEFTSTFDLVRATVSGRMAGWLPEEHAQAVAHIARVIRGDDGLGALASENGGAYRTLLAGASASLPLPAVFRVDVSNATDDQILDAVAKLIAAYVDSLQFLRNARGVNIGSPFDLFLARNALPATPTFAESDLAYARRLRAQVEALATPQWVPADAFRRFQFHVQPFKFNDAELRGLKISCASQPIPQASAQRNW